MIKAPTFFIGVVEDINDPAMKNRVRVRIYGKHTEDNIILPTDALPWTSVVMPVTAGSVPGAGYSHGLVQGSWVVGFFLDGSEQETLIIGSLPSSSTAREDDLGFQDPDRVHPKRDGIDTPLSALTKEFTDSFSYLNRLNQRIKNIPLASQPQLSTLTADEREPFLQESLLDPADIQKTTYPSNQVYQTEAGHSLEYDNTAGYERICETHASGTYREVIADGTTTHVITGDGYKVVAGKNTVYIVGNCNMTVGGDLRTLVRGNYHLEVEGDMTENIRGSRKTKIGKSSLEEIAGSRGVNIALDETINIGGNQRETINSNVLFTCAGTLDSTVTGDRTETTLSRHLITSAQNMKINCGEKIHVNTKVTRFSGDAIAGGSGVSLITHLHTQKNGNDAGGGANTTAPIGGTAVGT